MWKNYLLSAWRFLLRNRLASFINIFGLAAGLSAGILILLYLQSEQNYDKHHPDTDRIFRLTSHMELVDQKDHLGRNSLRTGPEMLSMFPEVQGFCRLVPIGKQSIWYENRMFSESGIAFADSTFFDFFSYGFVTGDRATCLDEPRSIVIREDVADKYFGNAQEALGKMLRFTRQSYKVTGVFKKPVAETHIPFNFIISLSSMHPQTYEQAMTDYFRMMTFTYLRVKENVKGEQLESKFPQFYTTHIQPWIKQNNVQGNLTFSLQPLTDIHLNNRLSYDYENNSNPAYVYIFGIVGIFILLVACINYMNLATARAGKRSREVGVRMVSGAGRGQLILQFMTESLLVCLFALLLALAMVELLFPLFNELTDKDFSHVTLFQSGHLFTLLLLTLAVAMFSGSYPAFFLSRVKPAQVMKMGNAPAAIYKGWKRWLSPVAFRRVLVVIQFAISIALIISTLVVYGQLDYMKNKDLGFDRQNLLVITIPADSAVNGNLPSIKNELGKRTDVSGLASSSNVPGERYGELYFVVDQPEGKVNKFLGYTWVDEDFFPLLGLPIEGRNFSRAFPADAQNAFIINESCARFLGWKDPIGKEMENGFGVKGKVVGVVKDYHYSSLHQPIGPMVYMYSPQTAHNLFIRVQSPDMAASVEAILDRWKKFVPNHPMESFILEDYLASNYVKETKMLQVFGYFTVLTIVISCLGLFGLAAFNTEQRTKEIGIRKVLGASVGSISGLLAREFLGLVFVSNLLAVPPALYYLNHWLQTFAYRMELTAEPFIYSALLAILVAVLTVSALAIRAASANPVKSLRYE